MKLRILSDTHIDPYEKNYSVVISRINCTFGDISRDEILILPGDLGYVTDDKGVITNEYDNFLRFVKTKWRHVILVPGNTEYHGITDSSSLKVTEEVLKKKCEELGIHYLQKDIMKIDDVYVLGCTLWKFTNPKEWKELPFEDREIFTKNEFYRLQYVDHLEWLNEQLMEISKLGKEAIVITHYPPMTNYKEIQFKWVDEQGIIHYSDHISHFIWEYRKTIKAWICGHVHDNTFREIAKVPIYINAMGEMNESYKLADGLINI
jgi:predicted phosphohydrolase